MKILFLGPYKESQKKIINYLKQDKNQIINISTNINFEHIDDSFDFLLSYGYKYKIKKEILEKIKIISFNLHISYLPWNKGADPNFWSFAENTPRGVSIHEINENIDDGPIIYRRKIAYRKSDTLFSSYNDLLTSIESLFFDKWKYLKNKNYIKKVIKEKGSFHSSGDIENYINFLHNGWDTKVKNIIGIAK